MLNHTFIHLPGVGHATEKKIWESGILTWSDYLSASPSDLPIKVNSHHMEIIEQSVANANNLDFFIRLIPAQEHWRLYGSFRDRAMYFDIETDGMRNQDSMTSVTLFDSAGLRSYVRGRDLLKAAEDLGSARFLISFYGRNFDVPVIELNLNMRVKIPHLDLYYVFRSLDIRGGLKKIEERFSISRGNLQGVDGFYAVLLWRYYCNMDDERALHTLLAYNVEDVLNLGELSRIAYNLKVKSLSLFDQELIQEPFHRPENPYRASDEIIALVRDHITAHGRFI